MADNGSIRLKDAKSDLVKAVSPSGYNSYYEQNNLSQEQEEVIHKTILVGDSGVGKTSILVQFDQGKFQTGSFSATVGIGFTEAREIMKKSRGKLRKNYYGNIQQRLTEPEPYDVAYKIMMVGDSGVGKTCFLIRFKDGTFLSAGLFISTVGIDFRNKVVVVEETRVKLQIWDTAGQERFRSVTHAYYRDAHALLLLYDVSNKNSFDNTRAWLGEINDYAQEDVVIMLLGNKADMNQDRVIKTEDGERLAKEYNVAFMETSAKTGMNVELAFMAVARELKYRKSPTTDNPRFNVNDFVQANSHKTGCCS